MHRSTPLTPNQGGIFQVRIRGGNNDSPLHTLTVDPLPEAPGAFADLVATMRVHLELQAAQVGTTLEDLQSTAAGELNPGLLPLKLAQSYLDSDADAHDLTDLAANADDFLDAETADLLDRLFGYFDLERYLELQIESLEPGSLPFMDPAASRRACISAGPEISSAPELSQAMIRSAVAAYGADPDSDAGRILSSGGTMLTGAGFVPGYGRVAAVAGVALSAVNAAMGAIAGTYPSSFVSIECEVDKTEFAEDSTETATWEKVWVVAASTGWSADQFIATSVISLLGGAISDAGAAKILDSDILRDVAGLGLGAGAAELFEDTGVIELCPREWRVDISSPLYSTAAALNHRFEVDIPGQTVTPKEVGSDQLRVAAQAPQFGGREIHIDVPMQVKQIQVLTNPDVIVVENPGESININAEIINADLTTLRWTPERGGWDDGLGSDTNDGRTRSLETPTQPEAYPFLVRIESLTRNGLRESGIPQRIGYVSVRYNDPRIQIDPQYVCISPGERQQFTAEVVGVEDYTVVWNVIEGYGSIDENGLYQSLSGGTSNAVIEAKLEGNEAVSDTARLDAGACNCSLDVSITGDSSWSQQSSQAAFLVSSFEDLFYQFFFGLDLEGPPLIGASFGGFDDQPSPRPGDTGTWRASFVYSTASESWAGIWDDEKIPLPGVSITITEFTESYMVGYFSGNAFQLNENGEVSSVVGVNVDFRAGYWDGGAWPCE